MTATIHHLRRPYRVLVTGSRDWRDEQELRLALVGEAILRLESGVPVVITHDACPSGAAAMAAQWAADYGVPAGPHPAGWDQAVAAGADACLTFIRDGSQDVTRRADAAEKAGIPVRRFLS